MDLRGPAGARPGLAEPGEWRGRRVAVVGLGVSNLALTRFLVRQGAMVEVRDRASPASLGERLLEARRLGCAERLGPGYLDGLERFDCVFLTPGMRKDLPELVRLRAAGVPVASEVGLVFRYCRAPILGVTGSAGKTTTTSLLGEMCRLAFPETYVGGNLGRPLVEEAAAISPGARVVLELSSFQLELLDASPNLATVLNLRPNHLDVHGSFEAYAQAKRRIFDRQGPGDWCVFNADDALSSGWMREAPGRVAAFSLRGRPEAPGVWLERGTVWTDLAPALAGPSPGRADEAREGPLAPRAIFRPEELRLPGRHNLANAMAAAALAVLSGVPDRHVASAVRAFQGVPHRLEVVAEKGGVLVVNDSIATAPDRTEAALATFDRPLVLIAGGYDKGIAFDRLAEAVCGRVRDLVLVGQTADKIEAAVREAARARAGAGDGGPGGDADGRPGPAVHRASGFAEAVRLALELARPGDVVLLSPASASYDLFRDFEERGETFRRLVRAWAAEGRA
ncbi:MAG: UDP-N-acetylmuramoyl-L-alanine--D-glutamate ligase [Clostridia bacterium]|nr:UDP-N-acetylmuramoyl-L-alanine--D-glutamate ligase [Clostridia bacterium]